MKIDWKGIRELETALQRKSETDFDKVVNKNLTEMRDRGVSASVAGGGTPVDTSALRRDLSVSASSGEVGYMLDYAPHVEYGHRQNVGQFVPVLKRRLVKPYIEGQYFLKRNKDIQAGIYKSDLERVLKAHD